MPYLPQIYETPQSSDVTDVFYGYKHKLKIGAGEFYDTENLSTRDFPMLTTRRRRGRVADIYPSRNILEKDALAYIKDDTLYYDGKDIATHIGLSAGEKQFVKFGAYILVFPDAFYVNTKKPSDCGTIDARFSLGGAVTDYSLCTLDGANLNATSSATAPANPANGDYWLDTTNNSLKRWSGAQSLWASIATVYTKITFRDFPFTLSSFFSEHDGIKLTGTKYPEILDGDKIIYGLGNDETNNTAYIVVTGLIPAAATGYTSDISINRVMPELDYVFECQNRLWGCRYGDNGDGKFLNEIYCSALGDFKNWRQYLGLSTDSWTASVGSDGPWTGAVNYLGTPMFFKENCVHRVTISATGAHRIDEMQCRGVMKGCSKSLAVVEEKLIYKSRSDFCVFQGGFPEGISTALGDEQYFDVIAGVHNSKYYCSMKDHAGNWHLFVYDSKQNLWIREDDFHANGFASVGDILYAVDDKGILWDLTGQTGETERQLKWMAQTGILYYQITRKKSVSRFNIRINATKGSTVSVFCRYDSDGLWRFQGRIAFSGTNTVTFPVRPRRCDHMEIKLEGQGDAKLFSIARIVEEGSDM